MAVLLQCKQDDCTVGTTGICMEGVRPAATCPHLHHLLVVTGESTESPPIQARPADPMPALGSVVDLPSGDDLSVAQAAALRRAEGGVVVALAGDRFVGKTTLLASLYDHFLDGPWAGFRFAGSETLVGFERRLHLARKGSGLSKPNTQHTSRTAPLHFLHLRLKRIESGQRQNLLVSDLSGEKFADAADNQEVCRKELQHLRQADRVALCLDGDKLIDLKERQRTVALAKSLLGNLLAVGHLDHTSIVDVLITKWDKVLSAPNTEAHQSFIKQQVETKLQGEFGARLAHLKCFRIAARPEAESTLDSWYKLEQLLSAWMVPPSPLPAPPLQFTEPDDLRESERYLRRRLPQYVAPKEG